MSRSHGMNFGDDSQDRSEKLLPCSAGESSETHKKVETLSDVGRDWGTGLPEGSPEASSGSVGGPKWSGSQATNKPAVSRGASTGRTHPRERPPGAQQPTPETGNTGVSNRQSAGGIDCLEVSCYGFFHPANWNELRPRLDKARLAAESGCAENAFVTTEAGDRLEVSAMGVRHGIYCRFKLDWNGCVIAIVDNPAPSTHRLSVHLRIGSLRLMEVGHEEAWASLCDVLSQLGFVLGETVVGRVDLCTDHAGESMQQIALAEHESRMICRARKKSLHKNGERLETYTVGAGAVKLRIYDKAVECRNDPVKQAIVAENRWGELPAQAIRVEFQLRNKALKRFFSVRSVEDLFANLGTIAKWCTSDWFRITGAAFDRKNRNHVRADTAGFWETVQKAFASWTGAPLPRKCGRRRFLPDFTQLAQQAVGCVASIVGQSEKVLGDVQLEFMRVWVEIGHQLTGRAVEKIHEREASLAAAGGGCLLVDESAIPW